MSKVLVIGCGGVASVAISKCCQVSDVFTELCIASRTKSKCDALAAKLAGASDFQILLRHLLPNAMGPIIVSVMFLIPGAIFSEAFLSFLGIGIQKPMASWGSLANDAIGTLTSAPYQMFFPIAAISLTMFSLNFIGDGLRDALDPKLKK